MTTNRPLKPEQLRHFLQLAARAYGQTPLDVNAKQKGGIIGSLAGEWEDDHNRRLCLNYLFSEPGSPTKEMSSKQLTDAQWTALKRWIGMYKEDEVTPWQPHPDFGQEAEFVLWEVTKLEREAMINAGQMELTRADLGRLRPRYLTRRWIPAVK